MKKPAITTPVMRVIGVTDADRSIAFYRDVLGFEVHGQPPAVEAVSGPARIQFGSKSYAPNDWEEPRPPGAAALFFETEDADAMQAFIRSRGGKTGEVEKVNWIKMRMFEVRDPDGHALWFAQSYNVPTPAAPPPMLEKALPALPVTDVAGGIAYYRDVLGFHVNYQQHDLGVMDRDEVTVLLVARTERHSGIGSAYVYIRDADALFQELRAKGANLQGEPVSQRWGLREFRLLDPEGNELRFGQPFE